MRPLLLAGAACALTLAACGGHDAASTGAPVRLRITAPYDLAAVRSATVDVRGSVMPGGAEVTVEGRRAAVTGGAFHARVALAAGVNVIDVLASDGDAAPVLTAVRVRRIVTVAVPDVVGLDPDAARRALQDAGLKVDTSGGGLLDDLLGDPQVCTTDPAAGDEVDPGTTVEVDVAHRC